jgi:serine phosphatase RsbU (regulator of sigma subunit)
MPDGLAFDLVRACLTHWRSDMTDSEKAFAVPDLQATLPDIAACAARGPFRSMLSVPFCVEGSEQGLLVTLTDLPDPDLTHKSELLATLGSLAAVAISNARSYKREQKIAERLQQWILSTESDVNLAGLEVGRDYHAALNEASVGGDFFDLFTVGPDQIGIVIGDVSGKGLEAALHTQAVKHTLRAYALNAGMLGPSGSSPRDVLSRTNNAVSFMLPSDMFITLFYGIVNLRDHTLRYTNAGHDAPIVRHLNGETETLESTGRVIGLMPSASYDESVYQLSPGDLMLLYTDGVTEARRDGRFLEIEGVVELLNKHADKSAQDVVRGIYEDVEAYTHGAIHDDIALMVLRVPPDAPPTI